MVEATTARAALAILKQRNGDVSALFTDVDMPGDMNGLELAGIVYARWPHVAILVTSGVVRVVGTLPGGGVFLAKPYADAAPVRIIRGLIERLEASRGAKEGKPRP